MSPTARNVAWLGCLAGLGGTVFVAVDAVPPEHPEKANAAKTKQDTVPNFAIDLKLRNLFS